MVCSRASATALSPTTHSEPLPGRQRVGRPLGEVREVVEKRRLQRRRRHALRAGRRAATAQPQATTAATGAPPAAPERGASEFPRQADTGRCEARPW